MQGWEVYFHLNRFLEFSQDLLGNLKLLIAGFRFLLVVKLRKDDIEDLTQMVTLNDFLESADSDRNLMSRLQILLGNCLLKKNELVLEL